MVCGVLKGRVSVAEFHDIILQRDSAFSIYYWFTLCFRKLSPEKLHVFIYMLINIIQKNLLHVFDKLRYLRLKAER